MATAVRSFKEIPGPRNWPIFGNLLLYKLGYYSVDKYHETLVKLQKEYGEIVKENLPGLTVVHLFDPNDSRKIYSVEGKKPDINPLMSAMREYREMRNLNVGLGNLNGDEWYKLRNGIQPFVMRPKTTNSFLPVANATVAEFVREIKKRKNKDNYVEQLNVLTSKWVFEGAGRVFLETSFGCFDGGKNEDIIQQLIEANREVFLIGSRFRFSLQLYRFYSTPTWKRFITSEDVIRKQVTIFVNETVDRIKHLQEQGKIGERFAFLRHLLSNPELSSEELFILCLSMLIDGLTATSPTAVSCLYCLSTNPEAQEKLYKEVKELIPPDEEITAEKLEKMTYLRAFVKECFRVYPLGTEVSRITPIDLVLSNYEVPAGTAVDLNHMVHLKCEKTFPNPLEFQPERWINESKNINPYLMTPFSHGVRTCPGRRFAENDLFVMLCRIVQNFQLEYNSNDSPLEQVYRTLLFPDRVPRIAFLNR